MIVKIFLVDKLAFLVAISINTLHLLTKKRHVKPCPPWKTKQILHLAIAKVVIPILTRCVVASKQKTAKARQKAT